MGLRWIGGTIIDPMALLLSFFFTYLLPYLPLVVLLFVLIWYQNLLREKTRYTSLKRAVFSEAGMNLEIAKTILEFVESQKTGDPYVTPIPRFFTTAFEQLRNSGNLDFLGKKPREDLLAIYSAIERIHDASDRQEDLVIGAAAGSPLAGDLRSQNLTFIRDAVSNILIPRLQHFNTFSS